MFKLSFQPLSCHFEGAERREILKISPCGRNDIEDVRNDKEEPDFSLRSK